MNLLELMNTWATDICYHRRTLTLTTCVRQLAGSIPKIELGYRIQAIDNDSQLARHNSLLRCVAVC